MVIEAQTIQSSNWRRDHLAEHTKRQGNTQSSGLVLQPGNKQEGHKKNTNKHLTLLSFHHLHSSTSNHCQANPSLYDETEMVRKYVQIPRNSQMLHVWNIYLHFPNEN